MKKNLLLSILFILVALSNNSQAAEYEGKNIDGESFSCTAFSYETAQYYYLICAFSGSDVYLHFDNGGYIVVSMSDEEIDDPGNISAFDYKKANYWDLDVNL